ncbi:EF-hand calcium-binding domain-containing protein 10 [Scleropages formosus]|uniref:EF-hand calcium binding domain 10 n=1 Tax=Scleropages formosus TaxID=113540 RepID=A0A8C9V0K6_SCLFO|nr:EF-hand calcium-binding domain-containing protein 10 [Scleropages formosus]
MATPREREAADYLQKHKIPELMHNLTSMLFFHRPDRPLEFLIAQLEKLQASRAGAAETPCLFDHSNVDAVFGILDPTGQGHITLVQYKEALSTLGITGFDEFPEGAAADQVSLETFRRAAKEGLLRSSATYKSA